MQKWFLYLSQFYEHLTFNKTYTHLKKKVAFKGIKFQDRYSNLQ